MKERGMGCRVSAFICLCLALGPPRSRAGEAEINRFKSEYPAAAERLESRLSAVRGTCRLINYLDPKMKKSSANDAAFAVSGRNQKLIAQGKDSSPATVETVYCVTPDRSFKLTRKQGVNEYVLNGIDGKSDKDLMNTLFGRYLASPFSVLWTPLAVLMKQPDFEILSAEEFSSAGKRLFRVECEFGDSPRDKASIVLDPESGWIIRRCEVQLPRFHNEKIVFDIEYRPLADGFPAPSVATCVDIDRLTKRCEFQSFTFETTPDEQFKLGFYGLPELGGADARSRGADLTYWLAGFGIAGVVLAYALWRVAARPA